MHRLGFACGLALVAGGWLPACQADDDDDSGPGAGGISCAADSVCQPQCSNDPDCAGGGGGPNPSGGRGGGGCPDLAGAWQGSFESPEDAHDVYCLVFCENGRLFTGDSACTETGRGDFQEYTTWSCQGSEFTIVDVGTFPWRVAAGRLIVDHPDISFEGDAVADPGLCDDPARTPRG